MQIPPLQSLFAQAASPTQNASAAASSGTTDTSGQDMSNMFMQLLTAQLKSQSPLDPLDPNQFVGQLATFNSLSELVQIRQILQQLATK